MSIYQPEYRKSYLYGAADQTLSSLQNLLNSPDISKPEYIEKCRDVVQSYFRIKADFDEMASDNANAS